VQPNQGRCELKHSHFLMTSKTIFSINELKGTEVVMTPTRRMDSFFIQQPLYQVILLTATEKIPLSLYGTVDREKQEVMADQINTFLNTSPETSLVIEQDSRWFIYFLGSFFIIIGLLAELRQVITVTFDKAMDSLTIERQGLLRNQVIEHPLEEIDEVKLNASSYFNSKTILYQVVLVLKSGENILLTSNSSIGKTGKQKIVNEITSFLTPTQLFDSQS